MALSISDFMARARTPGGRKAFRYSLVSAVAVAVNQVALFILFAGFEWTARSANILACALGGIPSYWLNRTWTWGRTGRSHLLKEVVPFWAIAFLGLAFSTWAADMAETVAAENTSSRFLQAMVVNGASLTAFGILWVGKFIFFNKVLFAARDGDLQTTVPDEVAA